MASSSYDSVWRSTPTSDWTANGSPESGHNFTDQINEQQQNVQGAQSRYEQQNQQAGQYQQQYDDLFQNRQSYGDMYQQARNQEGVDEAKKQYQESLAAVNGVQSAMNALPSSINANSGRRLTQAQMQNILGNRMGEYNSTMQYWQNQNAGDQNMYQTSLAAAQNTASNMMNQQQFNISNALQVYQSQMAAAEQAYQDIINERNVMRTIYGQMYDDEYKHRAQELEAWATQVQAETQRYVQDQENARNNANLQAQTAWQNYLKDLNTQQQQQQNINQPKPSQFVDNFGNIRYANQATGQYTTGYVQPTYDNGQYYTVADPSMLANMMYGNM